MRTDFLLVPCNVIAKCRADACGIHFHVRVMFRAFPSPPQIEQIPPMFSLQESSQLGTEHLVEIIRLDLNSARFCVFVGHEDRDRYGRMETPILVQVDLDFEVRECGVLPASKKIRLRKSPRPRGRADSLARPSVGRPRRNRPPRRNFACGDHRNSPKAVTRRLLNEMFQRRSIIVCSPVGTNPPHATRVAGRRPRSCSDRGPFSLVQAIRI